MTNQKRDHENRPSRTVLLHIDVSTHYRETMSAAIEIAAQLGADLSGVFIEDQNLASAAGLEFVREFRLSSTSAHTLDNSTLKRQLSTLESSARRHLEHAGAHRKVRVNFQTPYNNTTGEFERDVDLIIAKIPGESQSPLLQTALPANLTLHPNTHTLLLLKSGMLLAKQLLIICDNAKNARKCLDAAMLLLTGDQYITLLPIATSASHMENLQATLADIVHKTGLDARIASPPGISTSDILRRAGTIDSLLIIASDTALLREEANIQTLIKSRHPVLFLQRAI